jgi:hypothetical protein
MPNMATQYAGVDVAVQIVVDLLLSAAFADWSHRIAADRADGLPYVPSFDHVYDHEIDPETVGHRFYAIVQGFRADRDSPFGGVEHSTDELTNRLAVHVIVTGDDMALMTKQAQRALVAARECIRAHLHTLLPYSVKGSDVRLGNEDYNPIAIIPGENNIMMKAATLEIGVPMLS